MTYKRLVIALIMGVLAGIVCVLMSSQGNPSSMSLRLLLSIFTSRVLIGFVIGISAWKMHWALHGILMGLIVSAPGAFSAALGATPEFGKWQLFIWTLVMGIIYGFVIELVTSVFFKAKQL